MEQSHWLIHPWIGRGFAVAPSRNFVYRKKYSIIACWSCDSLLHGNHDRYRVAWWPLIMSGCEMGAPLAQVAREGGSMLAAWLIDHSALGASIYDVRCGWGRGSPKSRQRHKMGWFVTRVRKLNLCLWFFFFKFCVSQLSVDQMSRNLVNF